MPHEQERTACATRLRAVSKRNPAVAALADGIATGLETGQDAFGKPSEPAEVLQAMHALKGMVSGSDASEVDNIAREIAKFIWK